MIIKLKVEQPLAIKVGVQCFHCREWHVIPFSINGKLVRLILSRLPVQEVEIAFPGMYFCHDADCVQVELVK